MDWIQRNSSFLLALRWCTFCRVVSKIWTISKSCQFTLLIWDCFFEVLGVFLALNRRCCLMEEVLFHPPFGEIERVGFAIGLVFCSFMVYLDRIERNNETLGLRRGLGRRSSPWLGLMLFFGHLSLKTFVIIHCVLFLKLVCNNFIIHAWVFWLCYYDFQNLCRYPLYIVDIWGFCMKICFLVYILIFNPTGNVPLVASFFIILIWWKLSFL